MSVRVITDSTADLPQQAVDDLGITVVPLNVHFGMDTFQDGVDMHADEFYERLVAGSDLPKTSAPSPGTFKNFYQKLAEETDAIVSVHISSKLSSTHEAALAGKQEARDKCRIEVINSYSVSMGLGLLAITAAKAAKGGATADEILTLLKESIDRVWMVGALDTLEFLKKGGRIGKAQAWLGSLLSIKPLISIQDGEVVPIERVRTRSKAVDRLHQMSKEQLPAKEVAVMYNTNKEEAEKTTEYLKELYPEQQFYLARFGPVLGTHVGPGCLAVFTIN